MYSVEVVLTSSLIVGRRPKNCGANQLSYRHAVRGTRKGQWEKRPAYPKASKVVGKTPSISKASKAVGKNAQHTPRRARQWEKRPAYPRRARHRGAKYTL